MQRYIQLKSKSTSYAFTLVFWLVTPDDGGSMFLRIVRIYLQLHTVDIFTAATITNPILFRLCDVYLTTMTVARNI
jgi:hypothetical protein